MNHSLLAASILTMIIVLAHAIAGELLICRPLRHWKSVPKYFGSEPFFKETVWMIWHVLDVLGLAIAAIIYRVGSHPLLNDTDIFILKALALAFLACGGISAILTKAKHPSWVAFLAVAGFLFFSF